MATVLCYCQVARVWMLGSRRVPIVLRYSHDTIFVIGQVETLHAASCRQQCCDIGHVITVVLIVAAQGGKACRQCSPLIQSESPSSPGHPLLPAPATPLLEHPPEPATAANISTAKTQPVITLNVLQQGPGSHLDRERVRRHHSFADPSRSSVKLRIVLTLDCMAPHD